MGWKFLNGSVWREEPCTDPYARFCGQTEAAASSDPIEGGFRRRRPVRPFDSAQDRPLDATRGPPETPAHRGARAGLFRPYISILSPPWERIPG